MVEPLYMLQVLTSLATSGTLFKHPLMYILKGRQLRIKQKTYGYGVPLPALPYPFQGEYRIKRATGVALHREGN